MSVFGLGPTDVAVLRDLLRWWKEQRGRGTERRPNVQDPLPTEQEVWLIQSPPAGIPPVSFPAGIPHAGSANCQAYTIDTFDDGAIQANGEVGTIKVWNTYGAAFPGTTWAPAIKDRLGRWLVHPIDMTGGGGGSLTLYELDPLLPQHGETFINVAGMSFPSYLITGGGYYDLQVDPLTPNTVAVFMRSQGSLNGAYQVFWSGNPTQAAQAPYSRFTATPIVAGVQVGVQGFVPGFLTFGCAANGRLVTFNSPTAIAVTHSYIVPTTPAQTVGSPGDLYLRKQDLGGGIHQLYWDVAAAGGTIAVKEIKKDPSTCAYDTSGTPYDEEKLLKVVISVPSIQMEVDDDPNNPNGVVIALKSPTQFSVPFSGAVPLDKPTFGCWDNPPYVKWVDFPHLRALCVGYQGFFDGFIDFRCNANGTKCTFETTSVAGDIKYKLPDKSLICDGKMLMTHANSGGTAQLEWFFPSVEVSVENAGASDVMVFDYDGDDFTIIKTTIGSAPCEQGKARVETSGLTANRAVYRYQCQGTTLQEMAGVVVINHGLIKSWTPL